MNMASEKRLERKMSHMGNYLNSMESYTAYSDTVRSPYFVGKMAMLDEIIPRINTMEDYIRGDTQSMTEILEFAHNTEIPLLSYNDETDLTALINLVYLSARDYYRIEREDKAGVGYVGFIFYLEVLGNAGRPAIPN